MDFDLVIQGGTLVTATEVVQADLGIRGERIAAVGDGLEGHQVVDARHLLVLPGAIDPHVHLNMPVGGTVSCDDWRSGTLAASYGGTTTLLDFVEPRPGQSLTSALDERLAEAEGQAVIDFGLHMTLARTDAATLQEIPGLMQAGVTSFKTYTTYDGLRLNDAELRTAMSAVGAAGGLMMTHCEDDAIVRRETRALVEAGRLGPGEHGRSRPSRAEVAAVERVLTLAAEAQVRIYIVHVSTAQAVGSVAVRQGGPDVFGETCPHYLLLTDTCYDLPGFEPAKFVCSPPLRAPADQSSLWQALAQGQLQTIGSDHCPFNFAGQKDRGVGDFTRIPGGLPGIEARLALLYTYGVAQGRIGLTQWVDACSTATARIFGLYPRKGCLAPGADADIVLFDPGRELRLSADTLHENVDYTPFDGLPLRGYPTMTILRGQPIVRDGEFLGRPGQGRFLRCGAQAFAGEVAC